MGCHGAARDRTQPMAALSCSRISEENLRSDCGQIGNENTCRDFRARDRRSPLTNYGACRGWPKVVTARTRCSKQALAPDSQRRRSRLLVFRKRVAHPDTRFRVCSNGPLEPLPERRFVVRNRIDIDHAHSRAIAQEIGERLRTSLRVDPELPANLRMQMARLRELKEQSPSIIPTAERWDKVCR